ncbi:hypothetical protein MWU58_08565 [Flavobacteriaceae bacterium S0825]|uniref:hypothetical protein n=1 Tax=Gaetbulibacter sp. S0825 TaxID=2720084 RepID=UPI0014315EC0|nr:hypothetical protein [Gaetbulibacter sp. S0825]MCK0109344.1 hypothetical protein [Flavobacteriaceae bacterium S0825]NIX64978.1 hypothetical protein [Gaetbulibacter sp. S0825]
MNYLLIGIILIFLFYAILSAKNQLIEDNRKKAFTSVTALMSFAIFISIILSVVIALNADMPQSIGYGGFDYIIRPSIFGILVLILYLSSVGAKPNLKFTLGLVSILINVCIGLVFLFN